MNPKLSRLVGTVVLLVVGSVAALSAADLEVVVHKITPSGPPVSKLDLLVCPGGPCTAVSTTDDNGRAVFSGLEAGKTAIIRALTFPCGPFDWSVSVDPKLTVQRFDVVLPATGTLRLQLESSRAEPVVKKDVRFSIMSLARDTAAPSPTFTTARTDSQGFLELCLVADREFQVMVDVSGFKSASIHRQKLRANHVTNVRIELRRGATA